MSKIVSYPVKKVQGKEGKYEIERDTEGNAILNTNRRMLNLTCEVLRKPSQDGKLKEINR